MALASMPKLTADFPDRLEFQCTRDMRVRLLALGFLTGRGGSYAGITRNLLQQALDTAIEALPPGRRKAFDQIMKDVELKEDDTRRQREVRT